MQRDIINSSNSSFFRRFGIEVSTLESEVSTLDTLPASSSETYPKVSTLLSKVDTLEDNL